MASTSSAPTADDLLRDARFSQRRETSFGEAPTASSVLSAATIDPSSLHPLAGLVDNKELDVLLLEDDQLTGVEGAKTVLPNRGWGDELCYGTGSTYLAGLAAGGLWGLREGLKKPLPTARARAAGGPVPPASEIGAQARAFAAEAVASTSSKAAAAAQQQGAASNAQAGPRAPTKAPLRFRWNNILNAVTRRGSFAGNNAGVLALIYNGFNSSLDVYRGGKHDIYGSMAAGAMTGLVWKSTAGVKPMLVASGVLTGTAAAWSVLKVQFL